jgi:5-methylcytosine-specific restriction endonuclease McrA
LLSQHGPVCAYCGVTTSAETITLDHVRPRKGQTAYDRPDNLVLACAACNAAKADMPFLAFLLARRSRGVYLLHYGEHLSEGIKEIVRQVTERPLLPPD